MSDNVKPNAACECGADVVVAINCTFPGMSVVLNPDTQPTGTHHVGETFTGQLFARRKRDGESGEFWVPHVGTCPLPHPRRKVAS